MWTIERVKAELPNVPVRFNGRDYPGTVRGSQELFAKVTAEPLRGIYCTQEVSWATLARCLNAKRPVLF
jgi:hypothetical protein